MMALAAANTILATSIMLGIVVGFFALTIFLQIWLCKKSTGLGLILPVISLLECLMLLFNLAAVVGALRTAALLMLLSGIPAGIYWGIWFRYYKKNKIRTRKDDLKRMNIEDLE